MRNLGWPLWILTVAVTFGLAPSPAEAQVFMYYGGGFGRPWYPPVTSPYYSSYMYPRYSSWGGVPYSTGSYYYPQTTNYYAPAVSPSVGIQPAAYGGIAPAAYSGGLSLTGIPITGSGTEAPRFRPTLTPAVAVPADSPLLAGAESLRARLQVQVPGNAELWLDGVRMSQTGTQRSFVTPPLDADKSYVYEVRISWRQDGQTQTRSRTITIRSGQTQQVDLTQ